MLGWPWCWDGSGKVGGRGSYEGLLVRTLGWYGNNRDGTVGFVHSNRESKSWVDLETKLKGKWSIAVSCVQMKKRVGIIGIEPRS